MSSASEISALSAFFTAALLLLGSALTLIGSLGLLRLRSFYERVHAPTLGTTLGVGCIAMSSIVYFSTLAGQVALREVLIVLFMTITTPITLMVLVRAALFRDQTEGQDASRANIENAPRPRE
ncbi:MAG: cation:proton antiporter [Rhizobiales bacterium]|nr:cation:proton antiporter [Hyphomicrobiales bacterium]